MNANECGSSASCQGVGSVSIKVCEPAPAPTDPPTNPAKKQIPCTTDAECSSLQPGAVCGEFMGAHACTIPCTADATCNPAVAGVSDTFLSCIKDQGNASRTVCLPNAACLTNPLSCVSFGFDAGTGTDFDAGF